MADEIKWKRVLHSQKGEPPGWEEGASQSIRSNARPDDCRPKLAV